MDNTAKHVLIFGSLAGLAYLAMSGSSATSATAATGYPYAILPGAPPLPVSYNQQYYITYQYPAMIAINPNVGNPNYVMTDDECAQYYNNYLQLQEWAATVVPKPFADKNTAMRYHWKMYGVSNQMSFMPFLPPDNSAWTAPPINPKSSGSGVWGSIISVAGTVATAIIMAGVDVYKKQPVLDDANIEVLMNGGAIATDIFPFFFNKTDGVAESAAGRMEDLIKQYA